jgi:hypothetical protein
MERLKDEGEAPSEAIISAWPASAHRFRLLVTFEALLESAWCGQYSGLLRESHWASSRSLRSGLLFELVTMSITFCPVRLLGKAHPEQPCLSILMMMIDVIGAYTQQACIPLVVCVRFLRPSAFLLDVIVVPFALRYTALGWSTLSSSHSLKAVVTHPARQRRAASSL